MSAVQVTEIHKSYFGKKVLDDVSLDLESGKFYALIGQNGSGKSTLMRILMRLEGPDQGDGRVAGFQLSRDADQFFEDVGYASEALMYPPWLNVDRFVRAASSLYARWDDALFQKIISDMGLNLKIGFQLLSRGQRMQVCMAYAFAIRPKLLLLDEVTAVLDARARSYFLRLCKDFVVAGGTVVMATNIVSEIHPVADSLVFLDGTKIRLVSSMHEVSQKFVKLSKPKDLLHPVFENPECVELRIDDDDTVACLLPKAAVTGEIPQELRHRGKVTAEDIFVYYTLRTSRAGE